ncbi:MAG: hypothetical protein ABIN18_07885 [Pseudomonadota bacterium]
MEKINIDDVELHLSAPDDVSMPWVGQEDLVTQVLAAWLVIGEDDLPLSPRLLGEGVDCIGDHWWISCLHKDGVVEKTGDAFEQTIKILKESLPDRF